MNINDLLKIITAQYVNARKGLEKKLSLFFPMLLDGIYIDAFLWGIWLAFFASLTGVLLTLPYDNTKLIPFHEYQRWKLIIFSIFFSCYYIIYFGMAQTEHWRNRLNFFKPKSYNLKEGVKCHFIKVVGFLLLISTLLLTDSFIKHENSFSDERTIMRDEFREIISPSIAYEYYYLLNLEGIDSVIALKQIYDSAMIWANQKYPGIIDMNVLQQIVSNPYIKDSTKVIAVFLNRKYYLNEDVILDLIENGYSKIFRLDDKEWERYSEFIIDKKLNEVQLDYQSTRGIVLAIFLVIIPSISVFSETYSKPIRVEKKNANLKFIFIMAGIITSVVLTINLINQDEYLIIGLIFFAVVFTFFYPYLLYKWDQLLKAP